MNFACLHISKRMGSGVLKLKHFDGARGEISREMARIG